MSVARRMQPGASRTVWIIVGAVVVAVVIGALVLLAQRDDNPTSAQFGRDGVRTFGQAPDDLPDGLVPADALDVEGTAAGSPTEWTAAVSFVVADTSREAVIDHVDGVVTGAGYAFRQRAYDDITLEAIYDGPNGTVMTVSYESLSDGSVGASVVLRGHRTTG